MSKLPAPSRTRFDQTFLQTEYSLLEFRQTSMALVTHMIWNLELWLSLVKLAVRQVNIGEERTKWVRRQWIIFFSWCTAHTTYFSRSNWSNHSEKGNTLCTNKILLHKIDISKVPLALFLDYSYLKWRLSPKVDSCKGTHLKQGNFFQSKLPLRGQNVQAKLRCPNGDGNTHPQYAYEKDCLLQKLYFFFPEDEGYFLCRMERSWRLPCMLNSAHLIHFKVDTL